MPPGLGSKGKGKAKDGASKPSRSRNTTPSSATSAPISVGAGNTAYLEISIGAIMVPSNIMYEEILDRHGGGAGIPDLKHLEALKTDLSTLSQLAASRERACDGGMRELSSRRKQRLEEDVETEHREAEERITLKRSAEDDQFEKISKNKLKKRKDQNKIRDDRPLAHGAHGLARQDGVEASPKGTRLKRFSILVVSHDRGRRVVPISSLGGASLLATNHITYDVAPDRTTD
jgi:transcriptional adapter 3